MSPIPFALRYDGGQASDHSLDMRLLGRSLIGFEKIVSDGIVVLSEKRLPKHKERLDLRLEVTTPKDGCVVVPGVIVSSAWIVPIVWDKIQEGAGDILWNWVKFVVNTLGGRPSEADRSKEAMLEQLRITEAGRQKTEELRATSDREWRELMYRMVDRLAPAAQNFAAPIGPACNSASYGKPGAMETIDIPMADAIRSKGHVVVADQEELAVLVDGYEHHNHTLKIERPDGDGFMSANITDPAFAVAPNLYTQAAEQRARLVVHAKRTLRGERIERLHISNALRILPD